MVSTPANALNVNSAGVVTFDGTSVFTGNSLTQYNNLVGNSSDKISNVAPSATAGAVYLSGGGSANPSYIIPTAGSGLSVTTNSTTLQYAQSSGLVLIASKTASNSASIAFTSGISATYANYFLLGSNILLATGSSQDLIIQLSSNGGSSYITSGYEGNSKNFTYTGTASNAGSTTSLVITVATTSEYINFYAYIFNLTNSIIPIINGIGGYTTTSSSTIFFFNGVYGTATAMNALQILFASNNMSTGTFTLFGIL